MTIRCQMEEKARSSQERNTDRVIVADFFFPTRSIGTTVPGPIFFLQVGHNFIFYGSKANIDHQPASFLGSDLFTKIVTGEFVFV